MGLIGPSACVHKVLSARGHAHSFAYRSRLLSPGLVHRVLYLEQTKPEIIHYLTLYTKGR